MFDDKIKFDAIATIENNQEENRDCRIIFKKNGDSLSKIIIKDNTKNHKMIFCLLFYFFF
jgi:hypothetical protein